MAGALGPMLWWTIRDNNDVVVNGGKLYTYLSGTLTPASIYHDADLNTAYAFPAVSDSQGRIGYYMDPAIGNLKFQQTDENDVPCGFNGGTVDPVAPTNAGTAGAHEEFVFCSNSAALVTNTTYTSGATFDKLHPGSSVWAFDSDAPGTYELEINGVMSAAGTLTVALVNLSDGAPDTPIATAFITSTTGARAVSGTVTFPAGGTTKVYGIKAIVSANSGFVTGARMNRTL
jgi:hypothetical protein